MRSYGWVMYHLFVVHKKVLGFSYLEDMLAGLMVVDNDDWHEAREEYIANYGEDGEYKVETFESGY